MIQIKGVILIVIKIVILFIGSEKYGTYFSLMNQYESSIMLLHYQKNFVSSKFVAGMKRNRQLNTKR
jgi:hypothetical protein